LTANDYSLDNTDRNVSDEDLYTVHSINSKARSFLRKFSYIVGQGLMPLELVHLAFCAIWRKSSPKAAIDSPCCRFLASNLPSHLFYADKECETVATAVDIVEKHEAIFELNDKKKPSIVRQLTANDYSLDNTDRNVSDEDFYTVYSINYKATLLNQGPKS
jgi:hypothetical protein